MMPDQIEDIYRDSAIPTYRKLVVRDGCLTRAVLYGDTADSLWFLELIRPHLAFGQAYAEAAQ